MSLLSKLFGTAPAVDYKQLLQNGAVIVDVRTPQEYQGGHIKGSLNIPLQSLAASLAKLKKDKPVITCCASGMRSASARSVLLSNGFTEVYNAGPWSSLQNKL
jgi:rhodanese-related sulfurtransferase